MKYLNKILILTFILMIISIGGVSATDADIVCTDFQENSHNNDLSLASSDYQVESSIGVNDIMVSNNTPNDDSNNLRASGKVIKLNASNVHEYFSEEGYVDTSKISPYDTLDLSGNFSYNDIEVMIFTIPVTVTSTSQDAYLKDCTIQFHEVICSEDRMAKVSNLKINNTIASGFNGVIVTYSDYIEISNNVIYTESASGNPIRLLYSNHINVINNVLETWYFSKGSVFNASWTHSCILLGDSHYNYIAGNDITVKESNPIYLSAYGCGPSNYNVIFNNTIKSSSRSEKTGLPNPSSWTYGIQMMGSYNKVLNNTIFNVFRGISSDGEGNEIVGNILFNITGAYNEGNDGTSGGDYAIAGASKSLIANNTIYDSKLYSFGGAGGSAIYVGPGSEVYGNKITVSASSRGIDIGSASSGVNVYDNIINTESGNGIYTLGYMKNLNINFNVITSEYGIGIQIKKQSTSKYPTNVYIINNSILTSNNVFIDTEGVLDKSLLVCENNTCKKIAIITKDNFFNFFDKEGNLNRNDLGILVFKGNFDNDTLKISSININRDIYILGNDANIRDIQFNISNDNVTVENINFEIVSNSAIYLNNVNNVLIVKNSIISSSSNSPIIVSNSTSTILSNKIQGNNVAILVKSGSQVNINNNLINVTGDYTINLTNSGDSSSDKSKNNISNNCLLANLKGDSSVTYDMGCQNNNVIFDNNGLISNLIVDDTVSFVNQNPMLVFNLLDFEGNPIINGKITINLTDSKGQTKEFFVFTNNHGVALFEEHIPIDNYTFSAIYNGNNIYKSSQVSNKKLDVIIMGTSLDVSDVNIGYGIPIVIKATLKGEGGVLLDSKTVSIKINGKTYINNTVNGVVTFNVGILSLGNYSVDYVFISDENFSGSTENSKINVYQMSTTISASNVVMFYKDGSGVVAYLKDSRGIGIVGKTVSIKLNGKTYKKTTDKNGKVSLSISLPKKTYSVSIKFSAKYHKSVSKTVKVYVKAPIIKASTKNVKKGKKLTIYFKTYNGKVIANQKVYFKFKGKTYTVTTNSKGIATLTCSIAKGSYNLVAGFKSTSTYGKTKVTIKFKVV